MAVVVTALAHGREASADDRCLAYPPPPGTVRGETSTGFALTGDFRGWQYAIAPAGTRAWTVVASGVGGQTQLARWNTTVYRNGVYDIMMTNERRPGGESAYRTEHVCLSSALLIANLPGEPVPVVVSPTTATQDLFDASWGASSVFGVISYYEYALDCNWAARVQTTSRSVRLTDFVRQRGTWHTLCVRAVDQTATVGRSATSNYFLLTYIAPTVTLSAPATVVPGSAITLSASVRDPSGRAIANKEVFFQTGWGASTSWRTDASGQATVTLPVTSVPATYWVDVTSTSDGIHQYASASQRVTVERQVAITLLSLAVPASAAVGSQVSARVTLLGAADLPVPSRPVQVGITHPGGGGVSVRAYTDSRGQIDVALFAGLFSGTGTVTATFTGDSLYAPARAQRTVQLVRDVQKPSTPVVTVTPSVSSRNSFAATWAATDDLSGIGRYEYQVGSLSIVSTAQTSLPLFARSYGSHQVVVRAVDQAGNRGDWSAPVTFEWRRPVPALTVSAPASAARCGPIDMTARLTLDGAPLTGQAITFRLGSTLGGATAMTDASGVARGTIQFEGAPGSHLVEAVFSSATLGGAYATTNVVVTGNASAPCRPSGGGGTSGGGGGQSAGGGAGGAGGQSGRGGLSVDIPAR